MCAHFRLDRTGSLPLGEHSIVQSKTIAQYLELITGVGCPTAVHHLRVCLMGAVELVGDGYRSQSYGADIFSRHRGLH